MKRQLNEQEKSISKSNLKILIDDAVYTQAMVEKTEMNIRLAPIIYKKQLYNMEAECRGLKFQAEELRRSFEILQDQINNGVEVLEDEEQKTKGG